MAKSSTVYEWAIETVDEHDDILDVDHRDRLHDFPGEKLTLAINQDGDEPGITYRVVLVRDYYDRNGSHDRAWAYVTDDETLPTHFLDAYDNPVAKVPARFHQELAR